VKDKDRIKAVFFDAADTLFHVKGGVGNEYWRVAKKYGANTTPERITKAFTRAFKSAPPLTFADFSPEDRKVYEKKWWYDVVRDVFEEVGMFERFEDYFDELFETFRRKAWELFPETKAVLSLLKARGLILGIISNFDTRVYDVCTHLGIIDYFDSFVISSEAGFSKPSPKIFSLALSKNKVSPSECIHIGDSLEHDFYGASSVGIKVLLVDKKGRHIGRSDVHSIQSLTEIMRFVDGEG
jgi:putative hydrolase of the HAD superfamily